MARDLIVLAEDWGGLPTSSQHIIRHLPGKRRILWVNSVGMRRPRLNKHDMMRIADKARAIVKDGGKKADRPIAAPSAPMPEGMQVMPPHVIPWPGLNLAYEANKRLIGRQLHRRSAAMGLQNPHLWIAFPMGLIALDAGLHDKAVYYCADDYGAIAGVDHKEALQMERRLVRRADLVLATSAPLLDKFPDDKTRLLPHGVDLEKFQKPTMCPADLPKGDKVAGFYGSFLDRIDVELLRKTAKTLPEWQFVFIGKVGTHDQERLALDNVRFLGPRPHDDLPGYVQHWTVSLLPFRDCAMVNAMNPLKLREYLAAGTPIASVAFPALADYRHLVCVAPQRQDFAAMIEKAADDRDRLRQRRQSVADESWQKRAQQAHEFLEAL